MLALDEKLKRVKLIISDVDGVLTDGKISINDKGIVKVLKSIIDTVINIELINKKII